MAARAIKEAEMRKRFVAAALISSVLALVGAPTAAANDFQCVGVVTLGSFDNVVVPEGAFCDITNSQIRGNIKALANSTLFVAGGNTIGGNVEGDKARDVEIFNRFALLPNVIHGNGVIVEDSIETFVCGAVLPKGDIIVLKNRGALLGIGGPFCVGFGGGNTVERGNIKAEDNVITSSFEISDNRVGQNLQVYKNTGGAAKRVANNVVGESVQCFDNAPPFVGGPNMAPKREGQCF
jgi:hypothetical protein